MPISATFFEDVMNILHRMRNISVAASCALCFYLCIILNIVYVHGIGCNSTYSLPLNAVRNVYDDGGSFGYYHRKNTAQECLPKVCVRHSDAFLLKDRGSNTLCLPQSLFAGFIWTKAHGYRIRPKDSWLFNINALESVSSELRCKQPLKSSVGHTLRERVLLVDGTGLAYRCFFALPTLTTYRGTEIGAIVGFMNSLGRIYKSFGPKYIGIAFDSPGSNSTKREVWPEYKANRQTIQTSFKKQLMWIKEFCAIIGIPVFLKRATEADDIIASMIGFLSGGNTLNERAATGEEEVQRLKQVDYRVPDSTSGGVFDRVLRSTGRELEPLDLCDSGDINHRKFDVHVLTADKDLLQVLEYNDDSNISVRIIQPHKKFRTVDEDTVIDEYGIPPSRFSEYLALVGDSADNIPGVMGIGPKTAPVLISKYNSFKQIIESDEIAKIAKRSEKHNVSVQRAYDFHLITKLRADVPVLSSLSQLCKKRTLESQFVAFCRMFSLQKCSLRWHDVTH